MSGAKSQGASNAISPSCVFFSTCLQMTGTKVVSVVLEFDARSQKAANIDSWRPTNASWALSFVNDALPVCVMLTKLSLHCA